MGVKATITEGFLSEVRRLREQGISQREIATRLDVSFNRIEYAMRILRIRGIEHGYGKNSETDSFVSKVKALHDQGLTRKCIANKLETTDSKIEYAFRLLRDSGIKIFKPGTKLKIDGFPSKSRKNPTPNLNSVTDAQHLAWVLKARDDEKRINHDPATFQSSFGGGFDW